MDWKQKLSSRKLCAMVAGLVVSIFVLFGVDSGLTERISAMVLAFGSIAAYIFGETCIDYQKAKNNPAGTNTNSDNNEINGQ